jgi:diacylglycerol kinase family enzyme
MAGIAIIANPNARRNREWPLAAQQLRKAAPGAPLIETRNADELSKAARTLAADRPRVLAISGGDGTVTHTVTALSRAMDGNLPPLALLGGGAYDSLAPLGGGGDAEHRLKRLSEAVASGNELKTVERDTLRVAEEPALPATGGGRSPEHANDRCGFRFGVGLPVRFIEAIYATGSTGPWASTRLLLKTFFSSLAEGPFARRLYAPMDLRVRLDDEEWPPVPIFGLVCSTVAEAGLGLRPFRRATEQPGAFQALGLTAGPRAFALELPRLLVGFHARRDRLIEGVGERLELSARAPLSWLLDGEIYSSATGRLTVGLGPRVALVRA